MTIIIAVLLVCLGCGRSRLAECGVLIETFNRGTTPLMGMRRVDEDTSKREVQHIADELDGVASDAASAPLRIPELAQWSREYQEIMKRTATAGRAYVESSDRDSARTTMNAQLEREKPLVGAAVRYCMKPQ